MKTEIVILTGPVHSGKSTTLYEWFVFQKLGNKVIRGIVNPELNGRKRFINAFTKEQFEMLADENEADVIEIGKFTFSAKSFEKARETLFQQSALASDYFIVDEIGKLELLGGGLEPEVSRLLSRIDDLNIGTVILVVRDFLVDEVIAYFNLRSPKIVTQFQLNEI
ncbi:MAG: nucleoside-triphosphatase [Flavobacteriales bacterium]